jgi:hypothetical protein
MQYYGSRRAPADLGQDVVGDGAGGGKLPRLVEWLYGEPEEGTEFRYAPSIIVRGEAQLLGISVPRFAVRIRLGKNGFINGRRRELLARSFERAHGAGGDNKAFLERIRSDNWVADSLLVPPKTLREQGFHLLTTELGRAYGEGEPIDGTPFVTHTKLSGGLCAQAACFMAMALLDQSVRPLCGVAEITALVQSDQARLNMGGMTASSMVQLFRDLVTGCTTELQGFISLDGMAKSWAAVALRSYLASGCPVILLVSLSRIFGDHRVHGACCDPIIVPSPIVDPLKRHLVPIDRPFKPTVPGQERKASHAVVLVGWHGGDDAYVLNDPATYPFLTATIDQLLDVRRYRHEAIDGELKESDVGPFLCLPITPETVAQTLMNLPLDLSRGQVVPGLLEIAAALQTVPVAANRAGLSYSADAYRPGTFRLLAPGDPNGWDQAGFSTVDDETRSAVRDISRKQYYWVQAIDRPDRAGRSLRSLWVWDATTRISRLDADALNDRGLSAVVALEPATGKWRILVPQETS